EYARARIADDLRIELRQHLHHQITRLRDADLQPGPHVDDRGVHPRDETVDAAQEVLVILRGLERMHTAPGADDRELAPQAPPDLIDGDQVPRLAQALHARVEAELEHVARHTIGLGE